MAMIERVAVVVLLVLGLVIVLVPTLVVQMNLGAARDNTKSKQGMIGTTTTTTTRGVDAITEMGTRMLVVVETDDMAILRDATIMIERIEATMTEIDEMETSR
jgi:hypothetical protein